MVPGGAIPAARYITAANGIRGAIHHARSMNTYIQAMRVTPLRYGRLGVFLITSIQRGRIMTLQSVGRGVQVQIDLTIVLSL
jgi:hypothetical protein